MMTYRATWFLFIALTVLSGCAQTNPIYFTKATSTDTTDVLMMPYFTKVDSRIAISIALPKDKDGKVVNTSPPIITVAAINLPKERRYLYFHNDMWFNNTVDFQANSTGNPTKSDTSSVQQVIPMLTALGQAASQIMAMAGKAIIPAPLMQVEKNKLTKFKEECDTAFSEVVKAPHPFYHEIHVSEGMEKDRTDANADLNSLVTETGVNLAVEIDQDEKSPVVAADAAFEGYILHEPSSIIVSLVCIDKKDNTVKLYLGTSPLIPVYRDRIKVNPQRAFWNNPTDTITSDNGIITGHKYTNQSPAKTFVDLITAPVKALLPSMTNTTTTTVVSVPGKPDQTSSTSTQTAAPPK
jgi:hypothetical protein